jgi:hypothetical protein
MYNDNENKFEYNRSVRVYVHYLPTGTRRDTNRYIAFAVILLQIL